MVHIRSNHFVTGLTLLLTGLAISVPVHADTSDPYTILTWSDGASCDPSTNEEKHEVGCCGGPGRRACDYVVTWDKHDSPGCTANPSQNSLLYDSYDGRVVCNDPASVAIPPLIFPSSTPNLTFYVASDVHFFRSDYSVSTQSYFPSKINQFATQATQWPSGVGIPAGDTITPPVAVVLAGDLTTGAGGDEHAAYRMLWEPGWLPGYSINYPVYPGLGNHDLLNDGSGGAGNSTEAQRLWDYIKSYAGPNALSMDNSALGLLGVDDGNGTHNYSWNWQGVHYIMLNTWAGETNQANTPISNGLIWLKNDLAQNVGNALTPVVLFQHYGLESVGDYAWGPAVDSYTGVAFQTWWTLANYTDFWNVIKDYNILGMFSGHDHTGMAILRPEHFTRYANAHAGLPGEPSSITLPNTDSSGQIKIFDDFRDGSGGNTYGADGNGSDATFLVTRLTGPYMDVAGVAWNPSSDTLGLDNSIGFWGNTAACRKRVNTRFVNISDEVAVSGNFICNSTASGACQFTGSLSSSKGVDVAGTLAFKVVLDSDSESVSGTTPNLGSIANMADRDFVDSCDPYLGNAFKLVTGPLKADGTPVNFSISLGNISSSVGSSIVVGVIPYRLLALGQPNSIDFSPSAVDVNGVNPLPVEVKFVNSTAQSNTTYTVSIDYDSAQGAWLVAGFTDKPGQLKLSFEPSLLSGITSGVFNATVIVTGSDGSVGKLPVSVTVNQPLVVSPNPLSLEVPLQNTATVTSPTNQQADFEAIAGRYFTVTPIYTQTPAQLTFKVNPDIPAGTYTDHLGISWNGGKASVEVPVIFSAQSIEVDTIPSGLQVEIDGKSYKSPATVTWVTGTDHTISTPRIQSAGHASQYRFQRWSNGVEATETVTAPAYSTTTTHYTAAFGTYDLLDLQTGGGGTITLSPSSDDNYYLSGTSVSAQGVPQDQTYQFTGFTGALSGATNPQSLVVTGPLELGATFSKIDAGATAIDTSPEGLEIVVDGTPYKSPQTFWWPAGQNHTVAIPLQLASATQRYAFSQWSDGFPVSTRSIAGIALGQAQNFTADLVTQYSVSVTESPASAGSVSGIGWVNGGEATLLTATPAPGFTFLGFAGPGVLLPNRSWFPVNGPLNVQADFEATSRPDMYVQAGSRTIASASNPDVLNLAFTLTNVGPGPAGNAVITAIDSFTNLTGTGAQGASLLTLFPISMGTLQAGQSSSTTVTMEWPPSATRMQFKVHFSANSGTYTGSTTLDLFR